MTAPMNRQLVGPWRIIEADPWDRAHRDPAEPVSIDFGQNEQGRQAVLEAEHATSSEAC